MADKKKQSAVVVVATVMSITSVLSPVATVYAADAEATVVQQTESTEIRGNAPPITLPQELSGNDGQALQDIALPDGWSWTDGNTIISKEKPEYPARIAVDDKTYDYSAVEGYNAEEHFVEENIPVTVLVPETEESKALSSKAQVQAPQANSISSNTGEVEINSTDFPDEKFREYLLNKFDGDSDGKIAIAKVIEIDVSDRTDITDLKGVEKFTALRFLHCDNTGITALNVSQNTELEKLYCYNTGIQSLDVSQNRLLQVLECSNTGIQTLDVSNNTILMYLYCANTKIQTLNVNNNRLLRLLECTSTGIQSLNVSQNTELAQLYCYNTGIQDLNVSQNTELAQLYCYNTEIQSLDVSNHTALLELHCDNNPDLAYLNCSNTGIGDLDVSKNTALTFLDCSDTYIQSLNVSKNIALTSLNCSDTYIQSLNVSKNTALTYFDCFGTEIQTLDVGKITALTHLDCHNTEIQTLDVSKITALTYLDCSGTRITALDVSKNTQLKTLYCDNTGITALNVSKNIKLKTLYCSSTEILSLDVSKSPDLENLDTRYTNLAYLDWGTADLSTWYKTSSTIDLTVNGDTFDITKTFAGIDISKLTIISGGRLDGNNITDYKVGTSIQYTYVCGNVNGSSDTLTVTLNLSKSDSKIKITSNPNMTYTGNPVVNPSVDSKGSTGDVIYTYEIANGNTWDKYTGNPTNVGKYRVTAHLVEDDFNKAAEATKEFTISQATNDWTESIAMTGWMYGEKTVSPTAKAKFGDATFTYSDSEKGIYTDTVPTDAGTWYVKAAVTGTDNYTGLETTKEFTISQATNSWIENLAMTGWTYGEKAVSPTAKAKFGDVTFTYSDSEKGTYTDTVPTDAGTWYVKTAVEGTKNYTDLENIIAFTIARKGIDNINISDINNAEDIDNLIVKDGNKELEKDRDYLLEKKQEGNKVIVTITLQGNYVGSITRTYTIEASKDTGSVLTGDNNQEGFFTMISILSVACLTFLADKKSKNNRKENKG